MKIQIRYDISQGRHIVNAKAKTRMWVPHSQTTVSLFHKKSEEQMCSTQQVTEVCLFQLDVAGNCYH